MGRVFKPKYAWTKADGTRVEKITEAWYIEYTGANGRWVRRKAGLTKEQATDALRRAESDVLAEKNGLPTQRASEISASDLLRAYLESLKSRASEAYTIKTESQIADFLEQARIIRVQEITPDAIEAYMAELRNRGLAARSINAPLISLKAMFNWAVKMRRLPYNPVACVSRAKGVAKRRRRALTEDEIRRLLSAALNGPMRRAIRLRANRPRRDGTFKKVELKPLVAARLVREGRIRVLGYRLMLEAGLRLNEARSLSWGDVDLVAGLLCLRAETTKNGKNAELPIAPGLLATLEALKQELRTKDTDPVANLTTARARRQFDEDLAEAKIAKRDSAGRTVDFHALRHTFGTRLVASGADIKTVQALMRHSTPTITLAVYVHSDKGRMASAIAAMPAIQLAKDENSTSMTA